ncbi:hypothetical protein KCH_11070 [Kitasatospora cheerisanensis KCTC 2395]|uniref:Cyanobacterial TRADD-N associated 2 transmembrane domain-containing protein n=1 Tax=Kitasatospora cheerisanensis KCTC 2395 TaxID=1348663 RepID=A0A066Z0I8_9ACTN|nr:hypothetical protein KCH_11070 [Kitasatospora cheerisanensis KCTC 2395]
MEADADGTGLAVGRDLGIHAAGGSVAVGGDIRGDIIVNHAPHHETAAAVRSSLAVERQRLRMSAYRQALRHNEIMFLLSVVAMASGAGVVLTGAVLTVLRASNGEAVSVPLVTSLAGALITTVGGALAVHTNRSRRHLAEQDDRLDAQIERDHVIEKLRGWIDRVADPQTRDRLNAAAAMREMGLEPDSAVVTDRVLPEPGTALPVLEAGGRLPEPASPDGQAGADPLLRPGDGQGAGTGRSGGPG